jgi:hypothetical protein
MKTVLILAFMVGVSTNLMARGGGGGGGFHGGEIGEGGFHEGGDDWGGEGFREGGGEDVGGMVDYGSFRGESEGWSGERGDYSGGAANYETERGGTVRAEGVEGPDGAAANVDVHAADGRDFDATVAGPDGYRNGYIWQDGAYVAVNCDPYVPYAAPFGAWAGWSVVTQPEYLNYPVYTTYPIQTAVQLALQRLGLYNGAIDGNAMSCADAIEQYESENGLDPTGTITPQLLASLGIQATE